MLNKSQRVEISGKIVGIPDENKVADKTIELLSKQKDKLKKIDLGNKSYFDIKNSIINSYQQEIPLIDGTGRTSLSEQHMIDASNLTSSNVFFPTDENNIPPSLSNVWSKMNPFLRGYAVGKTYTELYSPVPNEISATQALIDAINDFNSEPFSEVQKITGQHCIELPPPPPPDPAPNPPIQSIEEYLDLKDKAYIVYEKVMALRDVLVSLKSSIFLSDEEPSRNTHNLQAEIDVQDFIQKIDDWLSFPEFSPYSGAQICIIFNGQDVSTLDDTRYRSNILDDLINAINNRLPIRTARKTQLDTWLGSVSQDMSTGEITSQSGFYGERALFIVQRLNRLTGSLQKLSSMDAGIDVNNQLKASNKNTEQVYKMMMHVSKFIAPANGTNFISVEKPDFYVGQKAYICSNSQPEVEVIIRSAQGNRIEVSEKIPKTYKESDGGRIYRLV